MTVFFGAFTAAKVNLMFFSMSVAGGVGREVGNRRSV